MTDWNTIDTCPEDKLVLLRKDFSGVETPMVVVGELTTFKGKVHHLWRGPYEGTVKEFSNIGFKEHFTHWADLGSAS